MQAADDYLSRNEQLLRLRRETFDVAVIGGGVNGAAVARDAAMRGLSVALIDRGDFAGQTSSRSTKLIHGGLRYLPQGQLRLVYEALHERERLCHLTAPHLVHPIDFLFPVYAGRTVSRLTLWAGLFVYDLLARMPASQRYKALAVNQVIALEPDLSRNGLRGGALYYDAHGDDSRLTLENVLDAVFHGAATANYVALEGFDRQGARLRAAQVRDVAGGERFEISARTFINAAGPWIDDVRRMDDPAARAAIRLTKGVHLMIAARRLPLQHSLVLSDGSGRIIFLIRDGESILLGTTDTDYSGERTQVLPLAADVDYLLGVVAQTIPGAGLRRQDIIASFAGLRALVDTNGAKAPSAVPREELIVRSGSGMLSIAGGKLTTHRRIAQRVVDMICRELGRPAGDSPTLTTPLPGARRPDRINGAADAVAIASRHELAARYGTRKDLIGALIQLDSSIAEPLSEGCPVLAAEAVYAARFEMAQTLEDFMVRRTAMARHYPEQAAAGAPRAAHLLGSELGWSAEREAAEVAQFNAALKASREV
ncbi:MAG TPA: glycerol-3-phosphate dehydrogenase/oxidase [Candidatus Binataceae bacterium]|jgi:glycerol-3-phosphate dehydrogenase|nr:glycerol-3-phosphate dehydrogenase/oxidase [Candidatus Binataceae bacterium]